MVIRQTYEYLFLKLNFTMNVLTCSIFSFSRLIKRTDKYDIAIWSRDLEIFFFSFVKTKYIDILIEMQLIKIPIKD